MKQVIIFLLSIFCFFPCSFIANAEQKGLSVIEQRTENASKKLETSVLSIVNGALYMALCMESDEYHIRGQYDAAIERLLEAQKLFDTPEVNILLGNNYYKKQEYEKAEEYFDKVIERCTKDGLKKVNPNLSVAYFFKALLAMDAKKAFQALEYCDLALQFSSQENRPLLESAKKKIENYIATTTVKA